jgi:hypothetical protein
MLMTIFGIDPGRLLDIRRRSIVIDNLLVTQDGEEFLVLVLVPFFLFPVFVTSQELVDTHMDWAQATDFVIGILVEDGRVVVECLEELEIHDTEYTSAQRSNPVDPVVLGEVPSHGSRSERSSGVKGTSGPGYEEDVQGKQSQSNADRC